MNKLFTLLIVLAIAAVAAYFTRDFWLPKSDTTQPANKAGAEHGDEPSSTNTTLLLSEQAQKNLGIVAKPMKTESFWKTIDVPGMVVERPGVSDVEVVAPAIGTISSILHFPGDTVRPGESLFNFRLLGETVHQAETDLYKAVKALALTEAQRQRLVAAGDAIAQARVVEVENEQARLEASIKSFKYELRHHGLSENDVDRVAQGSFVDNIPIVVPPVTRPPDSPHTADSSTSAHNTAPADTTPLEVQKLTVSTGQQVEAGQSLCVLSNHKLLAIEGRAFRDETPLLERSLKSGWPVVVDFQESAADDWPAIETSLPIRQISNTIDPVTRSFTFLLNLQNQSKSIDREGRAQLIWRFRPGQKVRLRVRVDELKDVFVLPADAVIREGADAYIFTQNVNTFERRAVHVIYQDRDHVVLANDGSLPTYPKGTEKQTVAAVVRGSAAQLNRMTRSGSSAVPKGYHIHADGSLHKNEDEAK